MVQVQYHHLHLKPFVYWDLSPNHTIPMSQNHIFYTGQCLTPLNSFAIFQTAWIHLGPSTWCWGEGMGFWFCHRPWLLSSLVCLFVCLLVNLFGIRHNTKQAKYILASTKNYRYQKLNCVWLWQNIGLPYIHRFEHHLLKWPSINRWPLKKLNFKNSAYSDFSWASCAQSCRLHICRIDFYVENIIASDNYSYCNWLFCQNKQVLASLPQDSLFFITLPTKNIKWPKSKKIGRPFTWNLGIALKVGWGCYCFHSVCQTGKD